MHPVGPKTVEVHAHIHIHFNIRNNYLLTLLGSCGG